MVPEDTKTVEMVTLFRGYDLPQNVTETRFYSIQYFSRINNLIHTKLSKSVLSLVWNILDFLQFR